MIGDDNFQNPVLSAIKQKPGFSGLLFYLCKVRAEPVLHRFEPQNKGRCICRFFCALQKKLFKVGVMSISE